MVLDATTIAPVVAPLDDQVRHKLLAASLREGDEGVRGTPSTGHDRTDPLPIRFIATIARNVNGGAFEPGNGDRALRTPNTSPPQGAPSHHGNAGFPYQTHVEDKVFPSCY